MHGQPIAVTLIGNAPTEKLQVCGRKLQLSVQTPSIRTNLLQPANDPMVGDTLPIRVILAGDDLCGRSAAPSSREVIRREFRSHLEGPPKDENRMHLGTVHRV